MKIPSEILFESPMVTNVQLSSDGNWVYYIKSLNNKNYLYKKKLDNQYDEMCVYFENNIRTYGILSEEKMYFLYDEQNNLYFNNLVIVDIKTGLSHKIRIENSNIKIINFSKEQKNKLIFAANHEKKSVYDLYELDLDTKEYKKIYDNKEGTFKWIFSSNNEMVGKYIHTFDNKVLLYFYVKNNWVLLRNYNLDDYWRNLVVSYNENIVIIKERGEQDTFSIIEINLQENFEQCVLYKYKYDISDIIIFKNKIVATSYCSYRKVWNIYKSDYYDDFKLITDKKYGDLQQINVNKDGNIFLLSYAVDIEAKCYYIYNRHTKKIKYLFRSRDTLINYKLSKTENISYISSDNIKINGYITKPNCNTERKKSLVVKIHGGPTQRDYWGYDAVTQFFASRNCYCLEVNYRGSFGYGKKFENLLNKELGEAVTNDIRDAIEYVINKYNDISNVFLYGWSVGGYIAIMTSINHCIKNLKGIIAVSAPLSIEEIIEHSEKTGIQRKEAVYEMFGHTENDKKMLEKQSIVQNLDKVSYPILYAYGCNDSGMNKLNIKKLEESNKNHKIISFKNDGHGINNKKNRIYLFNEIEKYIMEEELC